MLLAQFTNQGTDGKWDVGQIEASYLCDGQLKRIEELRKELKMLQELNLKNYKETDRIGIGAVMELELNGKRRFYFLSPSSGGSLLDVNGVPVQVISVSSPIGGEVVGLAKGDDFEIESGDDVREYLVCSVA